MNAIIAALVSEVCDELSDLELAVLNITAQFDQNPHGKLFDYEIVSPLFSEASGMKMHDETKIALAAVVNERLIK